MADRKALEKLPLTNEEKTRWAEMMHRTWQSIADDAAAIEGRITRSIIVELVCDADRLMKFGGMTKEENSFLSVVYHRPAFQKWARSIMNY